MSARFQLLATQGTPAPRAYSAADRGRIVIEVLCPEHAMTRFTFGSFLLEEAEAVHVVRCPVCGGTHVLVSAEAWVAGIAAGAEEMRASRRSTLRRIMKEQSDKPNPTVTEDDLKPKGHRDRDGFREEPASQGTKTPPVIPPGEDSGEWTRGGGADPGVTRKGEAPRP